MKTRGKRTKISGKMNLVLRLKNKKTKHQLAICQIFQCVHELNKVETQEVYRFDQTKKATPKGGFKKYYPKKNYSDLKAKKENSERHVKHVNHEMNEMNEMNVTHVEPINYSNGGPDAITSRQGRCIMNE